MAFALGPSGLTDAELMHRVSRGDPEAAAVLWVRTWPTALIAARGLVSVAEVPGLAAEALIGTVASIAVGSGPAYDVTAFVTAAVHELCEGEDPAPDAGAIVHPDVFESPTMGEAFAALPLDDRRLLWAGLVDGQDDDQLAAALSITPAQAAAWTEDSLGRLQDAYLRRHAAIAETPDCVDTHALLGAATDPGPAPAFSTRTWVHLSDCAVCTEAFHELAHSPFSLGALLGPARDPGALPVLTPAVTPAPEPAAVADLAGEPTVEVEGDAVEPVAGALLFETADAPPKRRADARGGSRWRVPLVAAVIVLFLAGGAAVALGLGHDDNPGTPAAGAAGVTPGVADGTPTVTDSANTTPNVARVSDTTTAATPNTTPSRTATVAPPVASKTPTKPRTRPSAKPSRTPSPTTSPTSASPTPTPTPTATPTKKCSPLQHLLGFC